MVISKEIRHEVSKFISRTSIQGMSNVADSGQHVITRIIWFVIVAVCLFFSGVCIKETMDDWASNPILITIERTDYPVDKIPFPTVTVWREDHVPDCFEAVAKIFDYFPFPCFEDRDKNCSFVRDQLSVFEPLFVKITEDLFRKLTTKFESVSFDATYKDFENILDKSEKEFVNLVMLQAKMNDSLVIIDDILDELKQDLGPIPGRFIFSKDESPFKSFLLPTLKQRLYKRGLPTRLDGSLKNCRQSETCRALFKKSMAFMKTFKAIFPTDLKSEDFLSDRPDFYLGRFFSMFQRELFGIKFYLQPEVQVFESPLKKILHGIVHDFFSGFKDSDSDLIYPQFSPSCEVSGNSLITSDYLDTFLKLLKHSQSGNTTKTEAERKDFRETFVSSSIDETNLTLQEPMFLTDQIDMIPFCQTGS